MDGATPLFISCQNGHVSVARELLQASVNAAEETGLTPIIGGFINGHREVIDLLIQVSMGLTLTTSASTM